MLVVIVDDDPRLLRQLPPLLRANGYDVCALSCPAEALELVSAQPVDVVLLDPALLPFNLALDLIAALRRASNAMLLALGRVPGATERVRVLEAGADDFLAKPFDDAELLARLGALLRRCPLAVFDRRSVKLQVTENLHFDISGRRLVGKGKEVGLTEREFRLLVHLVRNEGIVLSRDALITTLWGRGYEGSSREVDVYVRYLRQKIEPDPARPRYILTAWGRGYQYRRPLPPSRHDSATLDGNGPDGGESVGTL